MARIDVYRKGKIAIMSGRLERRARGFLRFLLHRTDDGVVLDFGRQGPGIGLDREEALQLADAIRAHALAIRPVAPREGRKGSRRAGQSGTANGRVARMNRDQEAAWKNTRLEAPVIVASQKRRKVSRAPKAGGR